MTALRPAPPFPAPWRPAPPDPDDRPPSTAHYGEAETGLRFLVLLTLFGLGLVVIAIALFANLRRPATWDDDYFGRGGVEVPAWVLLVYDTMFFFVPCGFAAMLAGIVRHRVGAGIRIGLPVLVGLITFGAILAGPAFAFYVERYVLFWLLPIWLTLAAVGTGRFRWDGAQAFGASLVLLVVFRPFYLNVPDFLVLFTAEGVAAPTPLRDLWLSVWLKLLRDVGFIVLGLLLLHRLFPLVQKRPEWRWDWANLRDRIRGGTRPTWVLGLGVGAAALMLAILADHAFADLLTRLELLQRGEDDTDTFLNMTPRLVFLLALAAGVGEELVYRGVLQTYLERGFRGWFPQARVWAFIAALVLQALAFGFVHAGYRNPLHVIGPFLFALLMGVVFRGYGLLPVIYAHVAIDIFAFGSSAARGNYPELAIWLAYFFYWNIVAAFAAVVWVAMEAWRRQRAFASPKS